MKEQGKISLFAAVLMSINIMVGSAIFAYPQLMANCSGTWSFLGWPLAALILFPIVWSVAQAARAFPGEGGFYNYCKTGINDTAGFLATWAYLLGYIGTATTIATIIRSKLIIQFNFEFAEHHAFLFYLIFITIICLLNLISVEIISKIQSFATILKLVPLFFVVTIIFFYFNPGFNYNYSDITNIGGSIPLALFGFWGFENCCAMSHLIKGGSEQVSKVIFLAFGICIALYTTFHLGVMHIMGLANLKLYGAQAFPQFLGFGPALTSAILTSMLFCIMISFLNTVYGASFNNIINLNTMGKKGFLFGSSFLAKTTARGIPLNAIIIYGIIFMTLITLIPQTVVLAAVTNLGIGSAVLLAIISIISYNFKTKKIPQLLISLLGLISMIGVFYLTWTTQMGSDDNFVRFLYATPIIFGMPLGWLMYTINHKKAIKALK
ncbi:MAG: hypothetical protein US69_C0012G0014 [candidate division TM6 bacterium GW2011_GWF2_38_10]|nr:MAG: hypothetical protein US69_C0012G0014 [candidate division TM6 bacterium GW2011_GWF2_38_10]